MVGTASLFRLKFKSLAPRARSLNAQGLPRLKFFFRRDVDVVLKRWQSVPKSFRKTGGRLRQQVAVETSAYSYQALHLGIFAPESGLVRRRILLIKYFHKRSKVSGVRGYLSECRARCNDSDPKVGRNRQDGPSNSSPSSTTGRRAHSAPPGAPPDAPLHAVVGEPM